MLEARRVAADIKTMHEVEIPHVDTSCDEHILVI